MRLLTIADDAVFSVFERVVDKWVFLTGKNNFKLAYIMLLLSSVAMTAGFLMFSVPMMIFFVFILNIEIARVWDDTRKIQKLVEGSEMSGALPAEIREIIEWGRVDRFIPPVGAIIMLSFMGRISQDIVAGYALFCLGLFFFSAQRYIALTINPGGKSILERAKEAIKNFGFSPALQPVPVRS